MTIFRQNIWTNLLTFSTDDLSNMRIVVGQGNLNINEAEEAILEIEKLIMHPNWE